LLLAAVLHERDAATRRAAREYDKLEVSEERLRMALSAGRMGVWEWNVRTDVVTWSDDLEAIHGMAPGTFPGTFEGFQSLVHPEDREAVNQAIRRVLDDGSGYDVEFRNCRPDGTIGWMLAKGVVLRDGSGAAVRMLGLAMDITERRRLEAALRERAQQLTDADRRKDEFLAMLAHELRNPLSALSTTVHLLGLDDVDRERWSAVANRQVWQLARIVDDLLDVARITQGKIRLRTEPVVLGEVVAGAVETVRSEVAGRAQTLTVSLPDEPIHLDADGTRLGQVLTNLLGNAVRFTPPGGSIWLTVERLGQEVVVRVRDTGAGLSPELLPRVFDLFVQGDASLERAGGGLGIGLTIVRRLVEMHGGHVTVLSEGLGRGSEFVVTLPKLPDRHPQKTSVKPDGPTVAPSGLRVLVVEDNADTAESLASMLRIWGHEAHVTSDGFRALEVAEAFAPHVVVSDLGLPGMTGYELARRIRARPGLAGVLLVALTGYGREEDGQHAVDAGFDRHLVKPLDLGILADLLRAAASTT